MNKLVKKQPKLREDQVEEKLKQTLKINKKTKLYGKDLRKEKRRSNFMSEEIRSKQLENVGNSSPTNPKYTPITTKQ